jgi:hypothetical protein
VVVYLLERETRLEVARFADLPTLTVDHQEQIAFHPTAIQAWRIFQLRIQEVTEE